MGTQTDVVRPRSGIRELSRSVAGALILAGLGVVAGFASLFVINPLYAGIGAVWPAFGELLNSYLIQPGFGLVAAGYIWWRDDYNPLDRVQTPSTEGLAWIGLTPVAYELTVRAVSPLLSMIGLSHGGHSGGTVKWRAFLEQPELIIPGLVVMFLIMAPMEELLYRGVIHDTLGRTMGSLGRVLVGGLLFGGMHSFLSGGLVSLLLTTILGLLVAASYERTKNLVVPIMAHAGYWLLIVPL
ncbi:lysostaphin resistance A-like protein [Halorubrum sp. FL23]|uniref:lysostaphin resistance A-like protein n=1 Tax=Halorubrum sp. FL23 TaxID=3458704 RepID=UPI0040340524